MVYDTIKSAITLHDQIAMNQSAFFRRASINDTPRRASIYL
ncbi:hypothetical protein JCM19233_274 [Vibrio astriarenae]|nr:hypothetical protein JCM19233_274 [Vibrio sp. C7]